MPAMAKPRRASRKWNRMGVVEVLMASTVGADGVGHAGPDRFSTPGCKAAGALPPEGGNAGSAPPAGASPDGRAAFSPKRALRTRE